MGGLSCHGSAIFSLCSGEPFALISTWCDSSVHLNDMIRVEMMHKFFFALILVAFPALSFVIIIKWFVRALILGGSLAIFRSRRSLRVNGLITKGMSVVSTIWDFKSHTMSCAIWNRSWKEWARAYTHTACDGLHTENRWTNKWRQQIVLSAQHLVKV